MRQEHGRTERSCTLRASTDGRYGRIENPVYGFLRFTGKWAVHVEGESARIISSYYLRLGRWRNSWVAWMPPGFNSSGVRHISPRSFNFSFLRRCATIFEYAPLT